METGIFERRLNHLFAASPSCSVTCGQEALSLIFISSKMALPVNLLSSCGQRFCMIFSVRILKTLVTLTTMFQIVNLTITVLKLESPTDLWVDWGSFSLSIGLERQSFVGFSLKLVFRVCLVKV